MLLLIREKMRVFAEVCFFYQQREKSSQEWKSVAQNLDLKGDLVRLGLQVWRILLTPHAWRSY